MERRLAAALSIGALLLAAAPARAAEAREPGVAATAAWLGQHARDPSVRILDARPAADYAKGHIPGAVSLPVGETLDPAKLKNLPDAPENLKALFSRAGVGKDSLAVAYDNGGETSAARLFWTLEYLGHERATVLDGGLKAWTQAKGAVTEQPTQVVAARFAPAAKDPVHIASRDDVSRALGDQSKVILDVRSPAEFRGDDLRAKFGGHIPGAVNLEWRENLDAEGRLKAPAALAALYQRAGVTPDKEVIAHCQTGQRSSVAYWALRSLGYPRVENYAGSWVEWGNDASTPKVQGP